MVSFYDAFINPSEGNVTIIVEYMDGGSLQDIVDTGGCNSESVLANISWRLLQVAFVLPGLRRRPKSQSHACSLGRVLPSFILGAKFTVISSREICLSTTSVT